MPRWWQSLLIGSLTSDFKLKRRRGGRRRGTWPGTWSPSQRGRRASPRLASGRILHLPWMRARSKGRGRRGGTEGGRGGLGRAHRPAAAGSRPRPAGSTPEKATRPSPPIPEEQAAAEAVGEAARASTPEEQGGPRPRGRCRVTRRRARTSWTRSPMSSHGR